MVESLQRNTNVDVKDEEHLKGEGSIKDVEGLVYVV